MRIDVLPAFLVAGVLSVTGGVWTGYKMSVAARAVSHSAGLVSPPVDAAPPEVMVGELSDGTLHLPPTIVRGRRQVLFGSVVPSIPTVQFFDFHHAICDTAEAVHGKVVRCEKPSR